MPDLSDYVMTQPWPPCEKCGATERTGDTFTICADCGWSTLPGVGGGLVGGASLDDLDEHYDDLDFLEGF